MVSMDSCFAGSMKLHVFTTMTSASEGCGVNSWPPLVSWPIMTSVSTRFFGHPKLTKPIFKETLSFSLNVTVRQAALLEVLLMVFFGAPEGLGRHDLGDDGPGESRLRCVARSFRFGFLLGRMEEDRRAVLVADVRPLPV